MVEMKTLVNPDEPEKFLTRHELAQRWRCSRETVKRRQRSGDLHPVRLSKRHLLYKVSEIEKLEREGQ
jgi:predicted site-specific integrase-resolvase